MPNKNPAWPVRIFAAIICPIGLFLFCGGAWLVALDGSPYYVIVGAAIVGSSVLLWMRRAIGSAIFQLSVVATIL